MAQQQSSQPTMRIRIERNEGVQEFNVPAHKNQTVLDVVSWIQQNIDATLTYRFSCRVGMCGSCAMMVNGTPRWTCRTHISKVLHGNDPVTIAPLRNLPVIKDLAVDMDPFFDKWITAGGVHQSERNRHDATAEIDEATSERTAANEGIECINCSVCYAACDSVAGNPEYLGPAALQRVWTLYNDERVALKEELLDGISGKGGCHNCHSIGSCTAHCPVELDPMAAIAGLKKATVTSYFTFRQKS